MVAGRLAVALLLATACQGHIGRAGDDDDDDAPLDPDAPPAGDDASGPGDDASAPGPDGGGGGSPDAPAAGEPPGLEGTLAEHNRIRADVGVGPMTWDPQLAAIAAAWIAQCRDQDAPIGLIDHNPNRSQGYPTYVGENVYGSSGTATGVAATRSWEGEKANYDAATNTCAAGRVCGHYTQIVWRNSTKLGCAIGDCPGLTYRSSVVCNYGPGGNISGQRPY